MIEKKLSEDITLKLEEDDTKIFVNGESFRVCKNLLLNISPQNKQEINKNIKNVDDISEYLKSNEFQPKLDISPEEEFWAHCSNLQAWIENDYNLDIIHTNLGYPLLKTLAMSGNIKAKEKLKESILKRYRENRFSHLWRGVHYIMEWMDQFERDTFRELIFEKIKEGKNNKSINEGLFAILRWASPQEIKYMAEENHLKKKLLSIIHTKDIRNIINTLYHPKLIEKISDALEIKTNVPDLFVKKPKKVDYKGNVIEINPKKIKGFNRHFWNITTKMYGITSETEFFAFELGKIQSGFHIYVKDMPSLYVKDTPTPIKYLAGCYRKKPNPTSITITL